MPAAAPPPANRLGTTVPSGLSTRASRSILSLPWVWCSPGTRGSRNKEARAAPVRSHTARMHPTRLRARHCSRQRSRPAPRRQVRRWPRSWPGSRRSSIRRSGTADELLLGLAMSKMRWSNSAGQYCPAPAHCGRSPNSRGFRRRSGAHSDRPGSRPSRSSSMTAGCHAGRRPLRNPDRPPCSKAPRPDVRPTAPPRRSIRANRNTARPRFRDRSGGPAISGNRSPRGSLLARIFSVPLPVFNHDAAHRTVIDDQVAHPVAHRQGISRFRRREQIVDQIPTARDRRAAARYARCVCTQ